MAIYRKNPRISRIPAKSLPLNFKANEEKNSVRAKLNGRSNIENIKEYIKTLKTRLPETRLITRRYGINSMVWSIKWNIAWPKTNSRIFINKNLGFSVFAKWRDIA